MPKLRDAAAWFVLALVVFVAFVFGVVAGEKGGYERAIRELRARDAGSAP